MPLVWRLGEGPAEQKRPHVRHVALRFVLVGVVPGAVQVEEPGARQGLQVLLRGGPRQVIAASLDDESGDILPGEGGQELRVRRAGRGLGVVVGVEAQAVQLWSGRLALAMECRSGTVVDARRSGRPSWRLWRRRERPQGSPATARRRASGAEAAGACKRRVGVKEID